MRAVVQRVRSASVTVNGEIVGSIGAGLLVLAGAEPEDTATDVEWLASKVANLRLFADASAPDGALDFSVRESGGGILVVSQFTLFASTRKGTRPSWHRAAKPEVARPLYEALITALTKALGRPIQTGRFGKMMDVALVNDGPITLILDTKARE
ncbi:MAG TPA: D-aminoacyl-tRNA deacylase [Chthoniobacteraceae bacterium]|jgi:D-tyrosyl-tRNA(Tyr) deacylase